jgi:hypothetical protein
MKILLAGLLVLTMLASCSPYLDDNGEPGEGVRQPSAAATPVPKVLHCAYAAPSLTNVRRCIDRELGIVCYLYGPNFTDEGGRAISCLPIPTSG